MKYILSLTSTVPLHRNCPPELVEGGLGVRPIQVWLPSTYTNNNDFLIKKEKKYSNKKTAHATR